MIYPIEKITVSDIAKAIGGQILFGDGETTVSSVSTDSRTVSSDCLFIPLKGEKFDGHDFLDDVCENGVGGYICSGSHINRKAAFAVATENTSKALLDLARFYRKKFDLTVLGLTGSVGKTTTKKLLASVISQKYNTLSTAGNFNNNIGVPLTLFGLKSEHEVAVVEMGMSNFGEIDVLSKCALPDIAVITNIGTSHIEFLGSQEGILKAKSEIFNGMSPDGSVILNGDDPYLWSLKDKLNFKNVKFVGIQNKKCDFTAENVRTDETGCRFVSGCKDYSINLAGVHNVYNALCAIAAGDLLGIDYEAVREGLELYRPNGIRQNIISVNGYKVINDCYNASPQSDIAAMKVLSDVKARRRIAVLGDIGELGKMGEKLHRSVGEEFAKSDLDVLVTVGSLSKFMAEEAKGKEVYSFDTVSEAVKFLKKYVRTDDAVLVKASRFMKFEEISQSLTEKYEI